MEPILEITGLKKQFSDFGLKGVNLSLERGYIMGFIGPNGAGKSTTIKLIMNLLKKDAGQIKIFGLDHLKDEQEIKNRLGFVLDENYYYEELKVAEMKGVIAPMYQKWDEVSFKRYAKEFDLPMNRAIKDLSKGMKMKFALAIALSHQAELLIMDEPTSGLDPIVRSELLEILTGIIQDENKAVFFSTHITSDLDKIADFVTMLDQGEVIFSMAKDDLLDNYGVVKAGKEVLTNDLRKDLIGLKEHQFGFEGLVKDKTQARKQLGDGAVIERPTLEDIMVFSARRDKSVKFSL